MFLKLALIFKINSSNHSTQSLLSTANDNLPISKLYSGSIYLIIKTDQGLNMLIPGYAHPGWVLTLKPDYLYNPYRLASSFCPSHFLLHLNVNSSILIPTMERTHYFNIIPVFTLLPLIIVHHLQTPKLAVCDHNMKHAAPSLPFKIIINSRSALHKF
jgi:hypothetical protein